MLKKWLFFTLIALAPLAVTPLAYAQEDVSEDDAYDPFADFSEFEAGAEEEADIHFFKNGRFFNMGFMLGGNVFTGNLGSIYSPSVAYGFNLTYFFDLRTAIEVSYTYSEHKLTVPSGSYGGVAYEGFEGNVSLSSFAAHMKYYFNTANITRGFADLNPYALGGFAINYRTTTLIDEDVLAKASPTSVDLGAGIEIPISRKKMYLGVETLYHYLKFPDENQMFKDGSASHKNTGVYPSGDYISIFFILGINF